MSHSKGKGFAIGIEVVRSRLFLGLTYHVTVISSFNRIYSILPDLEKYDYGSSIHYRDLKGVLRHNGN